MAWSWELAKSWTKGAVASGTGHLAVQGNKLWIAVNATGLNEIWYSSDGIDFTQDTTWTYGGIRDLVTSFNVLYAIHIDGTNKNFELYKRGITGWTKVAQTAVNSELYATHSHANDGAGYLMIAGEYQAGMGLRIWRYNTVEGLVLDCSKALPFQGARDVYYFDGLWFAAVSATPYSGTKSILRRVVANNWVEDCTMEAWSGGGRHFGAYDGVYDGLYIGQLEAPGWADDMTAIRRPRGGSWDYIAHPLTTDYAWPHMIFYGWRAGSHLVTPRQNIASYQSLQSMVLPDRTWESAGLGGNFVIWDAIEFDPFIFVAADMKTGDGDPSSVYLLYRARVNAGIGIPPFNRGDSKALVCDHQYGDTLYLGLRDEDLRPMVLWLDWDFADFWFGYHASSGSAVGVQTVELRNACIAYGQFGTDKQILVSEDKLLTWDEAQGEFGNDEVATLQFHPTNGQDLAATRRLDQDLIQTLTQRAPWTDLGTTPFVARSQLRVGDDIFIGSDTPNAQPVKMYSSGSWTDKSNGLPTDVAINDLELGY